MLNGSARLIQIDNHQVDTGRLISGKILMERSLHPVDIALSFNSTRETLALNPAALRLISRSRLVILD